MSQRDRVAEFEQFVVPHLGAAYNLACWLARSPQDAEDVVQEAYLRAFKYFDSFSGGNDRAWLLAIVRRTYYSWLHKNRHSRTAVPFDEEVYAAESAGADSASARPDAALLRSADSQLLREALAALPGEYREVLVLRELEELSYKEIADIADIPIGTVMSRLSRGRQQMQRWLSSRCSHDR